MILKKIKENRNGFTMTEFVVTIAIMGTLLSMAVPKFTNVSEETQAERNLANMHTIREVFFHYFYRSMQRKGYVAHFPPAPTNANGLMDEEWSRAAIDSSISLTSPNNLFSRGEVPKNANNNPFKYSTWSDTVQYTGEIRYFIKIEDSDLDSPTYGKSFTFNI